MITNENIKQKISEAIKQCGLTQTELGKRLKLTQSCISHYVNGDKMPTLDTLANLCIVLDLDANDILCINDHTGSKTYINNSFNNSNNSGNFNF